MSSMKRIDGLHRASHSFTLARESLIALELDLRELGLRAEANQVLSFLETTITEVAASLANEITENN